jgi:hypothetical protein
MDLGSCPESAISIFLAGKIPGEVPPYGAQMLDFS